MGVSVVVSTCNRCDKLRLLLDTAWPTETEVPVINNNSSDATKAGCEQKTPSGLVVRLRASDGSRMARRSRCLGHSAPLS